MDTFKVTGQTGVSEIILGTSIDEIGRFCKNKKIFIITDNNVRAIYENIFPSGEIIEIGTGEDIKTFETALYIYERLLSFEADRSSFITGIGGGIVCDITGFVASTYMRGIPFGFIPTTLLAQVDASIGGKNGVNFKKYKNIIGVFKQPEFVLCNINFLKTLPKTELLCGFAEIIKHAAIKDISYFEYLEENLDNIMSLRVPEIEEVISRSISIKTDIVNSDERESFERKKLNFGHTFGHAIEKFSRLPHGQAVSAGMVMANNISLSTGILSLKEGERFKNLLRRFNLPVEIELNRDIIFDAIKKDKKRNSDTIDFILLEKIGSSMVVSIKIEELEHFVCPDYPLPKKGGFSL